MRQIVLKLDDASHRLQQVRFLANGVLLGERIDLRGRAPQYVLHAWTIDADLSCTPLWGSALPGPTAPLVVHDVDDGGFVATSYAAAIHVWDRATGVHMRGLGLDGALHAASAGRLWLATQGAGGNHVVVASIAGVLEMQMGIGAAQVLRIVPLLDGRRAAVFVRDDASYALHVCDVAGTPPRTLNVKAWDVLAPLADGRLLIMNGYGPVVVDVESGEEVSSIRRDGLSELRSAAVSPDGRLLATIHGDQPDNHWFTDVGVHVWDLAAQAHVRHMTLPQSQWPTAALLDDDGRLLLAWGDQSLAIWSRQIR